MTNISLSVSQLPMDSENVKDETETLPKNNRRPRTSEDFYLFCTYVLQYENYNSEPLEKPPPTSETRSTSNASPPLDSSGSSVNSESTHSGQEDKPSDDEDEEREVEDENESLDLVTCFCGKPFAGRAMIECSICLTWIHLSCARIKKNNIPEVFHCVMCKSKKHRSSSPINAPDKMVKRPKRTP